jgi:glycosyltransferase involved in cell wall biosynthesis
VRCGAVRSMRILAVTNLFPNPIQPNRATFNRQQFAAIARQHALAVISPIAWTEELGARWKAGARVPAGRRVECDGIVVDHPKYLFPPRIMRGTYGYCFRRSIKAAFERAVAEFRPEVVLASWAYPDGWAAVDLAHRAGLPAVIKVHGSDVLTMSVYPSRRGRTVEALRSADGVIAVSGDLARTVEALGVDASRVSVVYNGVDTNLFRPGPMAEARAAVGIDRERRAVLFVGNLVGVKAIDVLIDACAIVARSGVTFNCYLIGQGGLRDALERRASSAGLADVVRFVGPKPHRELPDWFRAADVLVLPSQSEGVPNVLLEACACGTPFVASRVGGIPEILDMGDGTLVPPGDVAALAEALRARIADQSRTPRRVEAGRLRSHAESAAQVVDVLSAAMSRYRQSSPKVA